MNGFFEWTECNPRFAFYGGLLMAVMSGLGAAWIFAIISAGNGSYEGNILRMGFGLLLILISLLIFGTAAIHLNASKTRTDTRSGARY